MQRLYVDDCMGFMHQAHAKLHLARRLFFLSDQFTQEQFKTVS